jgi:hypothetical protein
MARIRTVKPEFFKHYDLFKAEKETGLPLRLAFQGLWLCADKEGRFKWQPMPLKLDILPYDDVDFEHCMRELAQRRFIIKYNANGKEYGCIPTFKEHQRITGTESKAESKIPEPPSNLLGNTLEIHVNTLEAADSINKLTEETPRTTGREGKGREEEREKEGKGNEVNFSGQMNLVPEMKRIWIESFAAYTFDDESDSPALKKIADFILKISGQKIGFLDLDAELKTLNTFQLIADQVNREPFWVNKPLKSIANHIQEFYNKIKNPINGREAIQRNGANGKLNIDKVKQAHARRYGNGE